MAEKLIPEQKPLSPEEQEKRMEEVRYHETHDYPAFEQLVPMDVAEIYRAFTEDYDANLELVRALKEIADEKGVSVSNLALLWVLAKYDYVSALIGTTSVEHLSESIKALKLDLTAEDIQRIESAFPAEKVKGMGMRAFTFRNGRFAR